MPRHLCWHIQLEIQLSLVGCFQILTTVLLQTFKQNGTANDRVWLDS